MNDEVYVNWPTGKDGPYKVKEDTNSNVWLRDLDVVIPVEWCEYVKPVYRRWEDLSTEEKQSFCNFGYHHIGAYYGNIEEWGEIYKRACLLSSTTNKQGDPWGANK